MPQLIDGSWINTPPDWKLEGDVLHATTGASTDFWRKTHYGFFRDNGHFWGMAAPEAFTATLSFEADYQELYDQAGMMLRIDAENWLKLGVEHSDGVTNFSIVVTRGSSDWSVIPQPLVTGPQTVRLTRNNGAIIAHFQAADGSWQLMRVAEFPNGPARIGPVVCSPERAGLTASFSDFQLSAPIKNALHS
jgi:regulation of enolase protein 1 (concanavalin A-like superfamily)